MEERTYTISELAADFQITPRTIRYYEEIGLLHPKRTDSGRRLFTSREKTRLRLVFRGKKYGFQLEEIKEMIQLFDKDPSGKQQLQKTIEYGNNKIEEVSTRIEELETVKQEMETLIEEFRQKLTE
ncbi:MerR family transcriptional regulator [Sediminibacillus halophilus]|uniref:DNA-binding transcriptional regulator, MerR family n=1 Tax=Sediminibacillus halophilus TaxID=482461 RepID=A0A1G9RAE6_9BACI|nr:MerR family DNA-binding transcriptional regulator [Sediminibacillus halophilus]SDM19375.1 DNA-binding transcriptional regulator, MerR family [Sediminibacillus halophilus]